MNVCSIHVCLYPSTCVNSRGELCRALAAPAGSYGARGRGTVPVRVSYMETCDGLIADHGLFKLRLCHISNFDDGT